MEISKKLKSYIAIADMLVDSFGKKCEVVIHDLTTPQNSVVYVANGSITNRQVGQSFDHLVKNVLLSKNFNNEYKANYTFKLADGKTIKSSTSLIRDCDDNVIGAFCINFEIEDFQKIYTFLNSFLKDESEEIDEVDSKSLDSFDNVNEIIDILIDNTIGNIDIKSMKRRDNIEIITFMYDKGIFLMKGAVEKVANRLNVSPVTIYSYLNEIKKNIK